MIALHAHVESLLSNQKMSDTNGKSAVGSRKVQKKATKICKSKGNNRREDKPAWMKTPPNDDEKEFELVEGKEYHRCPVHESWTRHKPSEAKAFLASPARAQAKDLDKFLDLKPMTKLSSKSLDANITSDDEWRTCPMDCEFICRMTAPNWRRRTLAAAYCLSRFQSVSSHGCATSPNFWGVNQQRPAGCQGVMGSTQPSKRVRWNSTGRNI